MVLSACNGIESDAKKSVPAIGREERRCDRYRCHFGVPEQGRTHVWVRFWHDGNECRGRSIGIGYTERSADRCQDRPDDRTTELSEKRVRWLVLEAEPETGPASAQSRAIPRRSDYGSFSGPKKCPWTSFLSKSPVSRKPWDPCEYPYPRKSGRSCIESMALQRIAGRIWALPLRR